VSCAYWLKWQRSSPLLSAYDVSGSGHYGHAPPSRTSATLATILVTPFMTMLGRLPIYMLMIADSSRTGHYRQLLRTTGSGHVELYALGSWRPWPRRVAQVFDLKASQHHHLELRSIECPLALAVAASSTRKVFVKAAGTSSGGELVLWV